MNSPPIISLKSIDFDTQKTVLSASIIMVVFMFLIIIFPLIAWIILIAFLGIGGFVGINLYKNRGKKVD